MRRHPAQRHAALLAYPISLLHLGQLERLSRRVAANRNRRSASIMPGSGGNDLAPQLLGREREQRRERQFHAVARTRHGGKPRGRQRIQPQIDQPGVGRRRRAGHKTRDLGENPVVAHVGGVIGDDAQFTAQQRVAGGAAPGFAAGRAQDAAAPQQRDARRRHAVFPRKRRANHRQNLAGIRLLAAAAHLRADQNPFALLPVDGGGEYAPHSNGRVAGRHGVFEIVAVKIPPADNDQILQPAGHEQIAVVQKTKIAGSQPDAVVIGQPRAEDLARFLRAAPVAVGNRASRHPDFADDIRRARLARVRIDNPDARIDQTRTAGRQLNPVRLWRHPASRQRVSPEAHAARALAASAGGHFQRSLGQAVARRHHGRLQSKRREGRLETAHCVAAHGFRAVQRVTQRRQIGPRREIRRAVRAQGIGEIRRGGVGAPPRLNGAQPGHGLGDEFLRRHQIGGKTALQGSENAVHQAHIVKIRQPTDHHAVRVVHRAAIKILYRRPQSGLRDHDTLRRARGPRGVLKQNRTAFAGGAQKGRGALGFVRTHPAQARQGVSRLSRQRDDRAAILCDRKHRVPAVTRRHRHGNHAGQAAAEESRKEIERFLIDQHHAIAGLGRLRQTRGDAGRPFTQRRIAERDVFHRIGRRVGEAIGTRLRPQQQLPGDAQRFAMRKSVMRSELVCGGCPPR